MELDKSLVLATLICAGLIAALEGVDSVSEPSAAASTTADTRPTSTSGATTTAPAMPGAAVNDFHAPKALPPGPGKSLAKPRDAAENPDSAGYNADYPTFEMRFSEVQARRDGRVVDAAAVQAAISQTSAWLEDESVGDELDLTPEERFDGRVFIRFNPMKIESLVPGDRMEIPLGQLQRSFTFVVDEVEVHDPESVSWTGHLSELDQDNQVVFTQGSTLTYAGITTPEGLFVVQSINGKGWIAEAGSLFKGECESLPVALGAREGAPQTLQTAATSNRFTNPQSLSPSQPFTLEEPTP